MLDQGLGSEKTIKEKNSLYSKSNLRLDLGSRIIILDRISEKVFSLSKSEKNPEYLALAIYIKNLNKSYVEWMNNQYIKKSPHGQVLIISASNITFLPLYLWSISFISGNQSYVRFSRRINKEEINKVLRFIDDVIPKTEQYDLFYWPNANDEIVTEKISGTCNIRLIWGMDNTIQKIRKLYACNAILDVAFKTRRSAALIQSKVFLEDTLQKQRSIAKEFYNDSLFMSFNACSSPHTTFLIGSNDENNMVFELLIEHIESIVSREDLEKNGIITSFNALISQASCLESETEIQASRMLKGRYIKRNPTQYSETSATPYFIDINCIGDLVFSEYGQFQTISHYGLSGQCLEKVQTQNRACLPDRFVRIGNAQMFDTIWDGLSFFDS